MTFCFASGHDHEYELVLASGYEWSDFPCYVGCKYQYAAFTVAELGAMIGSWINLPYAIGQVGTNVCLWTDDRGGQKFKTEAESRAELLIFLLESATIDADQVNERLTS
jgi:hypothetical protein